MSVRIPGLGDMLNHLARMHVLQTIAGSPELQRTYQVQWAPIPYLAMDAIIPSLAGIFGIYMAGKLFVCTCVLMPVAAVASLRFALQGRVGLAPAGAFLFCQNNLLSLGFLNFLFTAGWSVMLFALWIRLRELKPAQRALMFAPLVTLLYLGHVFACLAYCLCIAGFEIGLAARVKFRPMRKTAVDFTVALAQATPCLVLAAGFHVGAGYVGPLNTVYGSLADKLAAFASPMLFAADGTQFLVLLSSLAVAALVSPNLHFARRAVPVCIILAVVALCVPHLMLSTWGTDYRLPLVCAMVATGGVSLRRPGFRTRCFLLAALALLVTAKSADAWMIYHRADRQIAETRAVMQLLPRGARLLVVNVARGIPGAGGPAPSTLWNMPMVAVIDHDAFLPTFFSGVSTVHIRAPLRVSSTPNGFPITPAQLRDGISRSDEAGRDIPDGQGGGRLYHYDWPAKFDYVLIQCFGMNPGPLPENLKLLAHSPNLDLYSIRHN